MHCHHFTSRKISETAGTVLNKNLNTAFGLNKIPSDHDLFKKKKQMQEEWK